MLLVAGIALIILSIIVLATAAAPKGSAVVERTRLAPTVFAAPSN
jgi:hypothetical protein